MTRLFRTFPLKPKEGLNGPPAQEVLPVVRQELSIRECDETRSITNFKANSVGPISTASGNNGVVVHVTWLGRNCTRR